MGKTITVGRRWVVALDSAIEDRWEWLARGLTPKLDHCPLCDVDDDKAHDGCTYCPVKKYMGEGGCFGTPYWDWDEGGPDGDLAGAKRELAFLRRVRRACRTRTGAKHA